jgi:hypothetical protein
MAHGIHETDPFASPQRRVGLGRPRFMQRMGRHFVRVQVLGSQPQQVVRTSSSLQMFVYALALRIRQAII